MNYRYAALLFLAGAFALSTSAQAGTLTSEFELVPGGLISFGGGTTSSHSVTGGIIKVRYDAVGTRTPDPVATHATLLTATISHTNGKIVVTGLPSTKLSVTSSVGSIYNTISLYNTGYNGTYLPAKGTLNGNAFSGRLTFFTLYATTLPTISLLPAMSNASIYASGYDLTAVPSIYFYQPYPGLVGNEINRTFVDDPPLVPAFVAGPGLPALALLLTGLFAIARRSRAVSKSRI